MDSSEEGVLLIATATAVMVCFALAVLAVMLIYRKRKLEHRKEVEDLNERFEKELLRSQLEIQAQTMEHIGREIHDNVGSQLTLASLYTNQLPPGETEAPSVGEQIGEIIDRALDDLRTLSRSLSEGQTIQQTSLVELLRQECVKLNSVNFCTVTFENHATEISGTMEVNSFVLRIVQEFAQNSLKHARCSRITVRLTDHDQGIHLHLEDNGQGFDPDTLPESAGIGLRNMRQRAEIIHATYTLTAAKGQGTQLDIIVPNTTLIRTHHAS